VAIYVADQSAKGTEFGFDSIQISKQDEISRPKLCVRLHCRGAWNPKKRNFQIPISTLEDSLNKFSTEYFQMAAGDEDDAGNYFWNFIKERDD
jgi:hypothetical protein